MRGLRSLSLLSVGVFVLFIAAPRAAPAPADGAAKSVAAGNYECWAFSSARADLNFTVTGAGRYRASDGSNGTFAYDPTSKKIAFTGYLKEVMPDGFTTIYYEPKGHPTVSFRGRSGSEASFCEKV